MKKLLSELKPPRGAVKNKKRLGRGDASGHGGTSTKGHKGQKARAGGYHKVGFEGGQMPLIRRLPKRGFTNIFRKEYAIINLDLLKDLPAGTVVDPDYLKKHFRVKAGKNGVKVLGQGELQNSLQIHAHHFSGSAKEKIAKAGGSATLIVPSPAGEANGQ